MAAKKLTQNFFERHGDKIEFGSPCGCWLWSAGLRGNNCGGYGGIRVGGKMRLAHRVAYESAHGAGSAKGLQVRHRCDVPACVNPAHLELGTNADNVRDKMERGRHVTPKGEASGMAKLNEAAVRTIRAECVPYSRQFGGGVLARRFGVTPSVVRKVFRRELWGHVA